ncbi:hypothetical protein RBA63_18605 [Brenneria goodwinii]|uniref:hypothetical protein n=1 Tax=Brenneria goodwinii TaxID=1109412 RepID=UPI0036F06CBA
MKKAAHDFNTSTAEEIFQAIINKVTTQTALYGFMNRIGTNKRATKKALEMLRLHKLDQKRNARFARKTRNVLKSYSTEQSKERIEQILTAWRLYYAKQHGTGLMNEQILLLKIFEAGRELEKLTGTSIARMIAM